MLQMMIFATILACSTTSPEAKQKEKQVKYEIFVSQKNNKSEPMYTITYKKAPTEWIKKLK